MVGVPLIDLNQFTCSSTPHEWRKERAYDSVVFGSLYSRHVEALTGSVNDAADPDKVARACYGAAVVYAAFTVFCGLQVSMPSSFHCFLFFVPLLLQGLADSIIADDGTSTISEGSSIMR